jgi:hypothetical protein
MQASQTVPSPFNSPFTKAMLALFWLVYVGLLISLIVDPQKPVVVTAAFWTVALPWITWNFLSGVRVSPGRSVGGGPMYPRVALEPGEELVFNAPSRGGSIAHLFITNRRMIGLPVRLYGRTKSVRLTDITEARRQSKGFGWPYPKRAIRLVHGRDQTLLRPWPGPVWMGLMSEDEFIEGVVAGLKSVGVVVE